MARPKAPGVADIEVRFAYHPATEVTGPQHDAVRDLMKKTALVLNKTLPDGRHKALALTHLQEAMWAANAAIACDSVEPQKADASEAQEVAAKTPRKTAAKKTARPEITVKEINDAIDRSIEPKATVTPIKRVARRATRA